MNDESIEIIRGSGNVFADFGFKPPVCVMA
jgi:hypothetical protein